MAFMNGLPVQVEILVRPKAGRSHSPPFIIPGVYQRCGFSDFAGS